MAIRVSRGVTRLRCIMSKFAFILISILATSVLNLSAQVNVATPSSIRVHHFIVKGETATKILRDLAEKYRLVIGVYGSGNFRSVEMPIVIDVKIEDGTLADVFDAIADSQRHSVSTHQTIGSVTDQQFEWHQDSNGAVHFVLRGEPFSLMDVTVHSFDYENPQWPEITDRLRDIPEVSSWLRDHKCFMPGQEIYIAGQLPKPWTKFSVHARSLPLSSILDQITAESNTYYWRAAQITGSDRCDVNIQWWL
jgi:ACT domain-containing protein